MKFVMKYVASILCLTIFVGCFATKEDLKAVAKSQGETNKEVKGLKETLIGKDGKGGLKKDFADVKTTMLTKDDFERQCQALGQKNQQAGAANSREFARDLADALDLRDKAKEQQAALQKAEEARQKEFAKLQEEQREQRERLNNQEEAIRNARKAQPHDPIDLVQDWLEDEDAQTELLNACASELIATYREKHPNYKGDERDIIRNLWMMPRNIKPTARQLNDWSWKWMKYEDRHGKIRFKAYVAPEGGKIYFFVPDGERYEGRPVRNHGDNIPMYQPTSNTVNYHNNWQFFNNNTVTNEQKTEAPSKSATKEEPKKPQAPKPGSRECTYLKARRREASLRKQYPHGLDQAHAPKQVAAVGW